MCDEVPILGHDRRMDMRVPEPTGGASERQAFAQWD
jgi:hypothetical protein